MERKNNYAIQAQNAKKIFLSYDQNALAEKLGLRTDDRYLYTALLGQPYRIARKTGDLERLENGAWIDANSFDEVLTLLDLVCDSRADRHPAGIWKNMTDFGHQFHQNLMESRDALADFAQEQPDAYCAALKKLGRISPMPSRFLTIWKWQFSSGPETRSSRPAFAISGMRMPCSTFAMRPCIIVWAVCAAGCLAFDFFLAFSHIRGIILNIYSPAGRERMGRE